MSCFVDVDQVDVVFVLHLTNQISACSLKKVHAGSIQPFIRRKLWILTRKNNKMFLRGARIAQSIACLASD